MLYQRKLMRVAAVLASAITSFAQPGAGTPRLREPMFDRNGMPEAKAVAIMDMRVQFPGGDSYDAVATARTLQGLVNSRSSRKIYLFNDCTDRTHDIGGKDWNVQEEWLNAAGETRNLPRVMLRRETGPNGGLHGLLKSYAKSVKGFVVWDPNEANKVLMATAGAAITIATQKQGLPVSPALKQQIEAWGFQFPVLLDLREKKFQTDHEVLNWLVDNYWATSNQKMRAVFSQGLDGAGRNDPKSNRDDWWSNTTLNEGPIDYAVATNGFSFLINMEDANDDAALMRLLRKYPEGKSQIVGWIPTHPGGTGFAEAPRCLDGTSYSVMGNNGLSNLSVFGSFPDSSVRLPALVAHPVKPGAVYIAFGLTDGDAVHCVYRGMFDEFTHHRGENFGKAPLTWGVPPQIANLAPPIYNYFVRNLPKGSDLWVAWADKSNKVTDSGLAAMAETWKAYAQVADIPVMWTVHSKADSQRSDIADWAGIVVGYSSSRLDANLDPSNPDTAVLGLWAARDPKTTAEMVRKYAESKNGEPVFMVLNLGAPFGSARTKFYDSGKAIMDELLADTQGREYQFLSARDLAVTFSTYKGRKWDWR